MAKNDHRQTGEEETEKRKRKNGDVSADIGTMLRKKKKKETMNWRGLMWKKNDALHDGGERGRGGEKKGRTLEVKEKKKDETCNGAPRDQFIASGKQKKEWAGKRLGGSLEKWRGRQRVHWSQKETRSALPEKERGVERGGQCDKIIAMSITP